MTEKNHNSERLAGRVAVVTGGSRGIGAAIAKRLAADGASVAISYSASPEAAEKIVAEIEAQGGRSLAIKADAADAGQVQTLIALTVKQFGRLDILVNNAGVFIAKPVTDVTDADYDQVFNVNVRAVFTAVREAAKHMGEGGRVITIGSVNGERISYVGGALYGASKFAVKGFTKGWARELAPKGITVNVVQPGPIDTDMNPAAGEFAGYMAPLTALGRYGKPAEVAEVVAFLAGPESSYVTGAAINVDGGIEA